MSKGWLLATSGASGAVTLPCRWELYFAELNCPRQVDWFYLGSNLFFWGRGVKIYLFYFIFYMSTL